MGNKICVLHVVGTRPIGGIGSLLKNINKVIDLESFAFIYAFSSSELTGDFDKQVEKYNSSVVVFPSYKIRNIFRYLKQIKHFYKTNASHIDILHVHSPNTGVLDLYYAKKYGITIRILHSHSTKYSGKKINAIRNYILQLPVKKLATHYFACSLKAAEFLFGKNNIGNTFIIHNAIFPNSFLFSEKVRNRYRFDLGIADTNFVIGHVGNFTEEKNHFFLLDVFREVYTQNCKAILLLIGSGTLENQIRHRIKELELEKAVLMLGRRADVHNWLQAMDVFVFPSFFEGLPLTLIEAQTAGLHCIVSSNITTETNITNYIEYLSLESSSKIWAESILKYSNGYNRENMEEQISKAGYDIRTEVTMLEKLYFDSLNNRI